MEQLKNYFVKMQFYFFQIFTYIACNFVIFLSFQCNSSKFLFFFFCKIRLIFHIQCNSFEFSPPMKTFPRSEVMQHQMANRKCDRVQLHHSFVDTKIISLHSLKLVFIEEKKCEFCKFVIHKMYLVNSLILIFNHF